MIDFPEVLAPLFEPYRYKVLHGGRGSGKSWGIARALLVQGAERPLRILCTREIQKSIKNSVHKLLCDQIKALGLDKFYSITQTEIRGVNGTEFLFNGLSDMTADSIKSFESVNICWLEEGQTLTKRSLDILTPTIRKEGSEIWVSMNPELESDEAYQRFIANPPPNSFVLKMNYTENPWFSDTMEAERDHAERTMLRADYENIWLGKCRPAISGAIYAEEVAQAIENGRICNVPYEPRLQVHAIFDLGWNDQMTVILAQRHVSEIRVIDYIEDSHKTLDWYSAKLKAMGLNWGRLWLPHDGAHKDYKTGKSAQTIMQELGWQVSIVPVSPIEAGIRVARQTFPRCYFDKDKTARLLECLKRYRRTIPASTGEPGAPVHDEFSHACLTADMVVNTARGGVQIADVVVGDLVWTPSGYAEVLAAGPTKKAESLIEMVTANGKRIVCTPEHKVLSQRGFVRADSLGVGDKLFSGKEFSCTLSALSSMVTSIGFRAVITGEMSGALKARQTFTERFGSFITARSLKATMSTTKTATPLTTQLRTLSASLQATICGNTPWNYSPSGNLSLRLPKPWLSQPNGMAQTKAKNGTANTQSNHGKAESGIWRLVRFVAKSFARLTLLAPNTAMTIVKHRHYGCAEVRPLVYDLTVKSHGCFQANGVLVSNCDAFRYMCGSADKFVPQTHEPIKYKRLT